MGLSLLIHVGSTWAMVGVIWIIQVVVYPYMASVPAGAFSGYERLNQRRVLWVLALFAPAEVITGLVVFLAPGTVPRWMPLVGGVILVLLWVSTAFFYAPLHGRLLDGFDSGLHRRLVSANWLRTVGWSVRGVLVLAMVAAVV